MTIVDLAMLGRFGSASLAGCGLANSVLFTFSVLGIGTVMGMDTLVPQSLGAADAGRARILFSAGVRLALLLSLPICAAVAGAALLLPRTGVERGVAAEASAYLL